MLTGVFRWDKDNQCVCVVYIVYTDIEAGTFDGSLRSTPLTTELIAKSTFNLPDLELLEYYCRANAPYLVFYDNKMDASL